MISVNGLTRSYGDFKAVDNVSFTIRDGEITGLLGPNGAGKTTTLRMLSCYLTPDSGTIVVDGKRADEHQLEIKRTIGYLPESAPLYGDMVVYDYLKYIAEVRGIKDDGRIAEVAGICRIRDVMHKNICELSKGYRQRVGFAHAIIHDPEILILDEPTSGLDPIEIVEIRNLIKELGRSKTVILSTHILPEVEATCDRVIIINKGRIVADDSTRNLQNGGGGDRNLTVSVSGPDLEEFSEVIGKIDGVESVTPLSGDSLLSVIIGVSDDKEVRPEIFRTLAERNWVLYEMKQEQMSLESVFRELTTGGANGKV